MKDAEHPAKLVIKDGKVQLLLYRWNEAEPVIGFDDLTHLVVTTEVGGFEEAIERLEARNLQHEQSTTNDACDSDIQLGESVVAVLRSTKTAADQPIMDHQLPT